MFPSFDSSLDFIKNLDLSFRICAEASNGVKTVNALNSRKSALLSMMLLRHKVIALAGLKVEDHPAEFSAMFEKLIQDYIFTFQTV